MSKIAQESRRRRALSLVRFFLPLSKEMNPAVGPGPDGFGFEFNERRSKFLLNVKKKRQNWIPAAARETVKRSNNIQVSDNWML